MTNKLLSALLILGLSGTAKAIPMVWECESQRFVVVNADGVDVKRNIGFMLVSDASAQAIYPKGEFRDYFGSSLPSPLLDGGFRYLNGFWAAWDSIGSFELNETTGALVAIRRLGLGRGVVSLIGKCRRKG